MTASKLVLNAASGVGGAGLDVDEVFNTFLYDGTHGSLTVNTGLDLSGEGGLTWIKGRTINEYHNLFDTVRGNGYTLRSTETNVSDGPFFNQAFTSTGFSLNSSDSQVNSNQHNYVSWSFRKAPKFFDIVTYTGTSVNRTVSHNLGSVPGMIIIKCTSGTGNWRVYHRGVNGGSSPEDYVLLLNGTNEQYDSDSFFNDTAPTSTEFTVGGDDDVNDHGDTYVAYLFAHNDGDGGFGPDADKDIIKCGSYTGNGSTNGPEINLGFEPQWLLVKNVNNNSSDWLLFDIMRGWGMGDADIILEPNTVNADATSQNWVDITSTGFQITNANGQINGSPNTHIYMAIRRGPLTVPDDATKVFVTNIEGTGDTAMTNSWPISFVPDLNINTKHTGASRYLMSRLAYTRQIAVDGNNAEGSSLGNKIFTDVSTQLNVSTGWWAATADIISFTWKRAPSYLDTVYYTGTGSNRTISHNLGAVPEMMWVKRRSSSENWTVYHSGLGNTKYLTLDDDRQESTGSTAWNDTTPTESVFTLGTHDRVNSSGQTYAAFLFGTVEGISKVGSYTGNGGTQTIDCGFSSGARFILIRITGTTGSWHIWNSVRGIVTGSDPYLRLDESNGEFSSDIIDPDNSGFKVNSDALVNANGYTYIFYAIA